MNRQSQTKPIVVVLVPGEIKKFFQERSPNGIKPIFYYLGNESLLHRMMRKFGTRDVSKTLDDRIKIVEDREFLGKTFALWLSSAICLPPVQMSYLLDRLPELKWVYLQAAGTDHLNLNLFKARGVMVSNNGRLNCRRVAEMALASILAHAKRLPKHFALQRARRWSSLPSDDLGRQTVAILGTGNIGGELAKLCGAIGMHVIGASRNPYRFGQNTYPYHQVMKLHGDLEAILVQSDHVALTLPLTPETHGLIGKRELSKMKRTASLINVARGPIVDEKALCYALSQGLLGAAYIDRPSALPPPVWSRLYFTPNVVLTHYSSVNNPRVLQESFDQFVTGLKRILETGIPPDRVI
jgi:phosphoglycerate dehydrogenase-like enzyme